MNAVVEMVSKRFVMERLNSGHDWAIDVTAWMPLPKPYKEVEQE